MIYVRCFNVVVLSNVQGLSIRWLENWKEGESVWTGVEICWNAGESNLSGSEVNLSIYFLHLPKHSVAELTNDGERTLNRGISSLWQRRAQNLSSHNMVVDGQIQLSRSCGLVRLFYRSSAAISRFWIHGYMTRRSRARLFNQWFKKQNPGDNCS